jgi:hypothetical protein
VKRTGKWLAMALAGLLVIGIIAPYLSGNRFRPRIRAALESALGRKVDLGAVHFSLFTGPGFSVDNVVIHENPAIGVEPIAYVGSLEAVPRITSIFGGHLEFASIRLDDASINVAKTGGPSDPGRWNFEALLNRSVIRAIPELHVRSGRINFKFGDTKSVFYLTNTDLDIAPPGRGSALWNIDFSGEPARTDKPAHGLGVLLARGGWTAPSSGPGRLNLDVRLEKSPMSEMVELVQGFDAGIHGNVTAHVRFHGPLDDIRFGGSVEVADVHRWDQMPPYGRHWPLRVAGQLNLPAETIEMESNTAGGATSPLTVRFRCANYLSQPHWGVSLNWNQFPAGPVLDLARHMGAAVPAGLSMTGWLDGVLGYSGQGSLAGRLAFHDAAVGMPNSPPIRSLGGQLIFDRGHVRLEPTPVLTAQNETAQLQADYDWAAQLLNVTVSTDSMRIESLRAQAALAAIPWLDQVTSGVWNGQLRYQYSAAAPVSADAPAKPGWSGSFDLADASLALPGIAGPIVVHSAGVHLEGARVVLDHVHGEAGKITFDGDYRYEPQGARPHRLRLHIAQADLAEVERLLLPSLSRDRGLIARALSLGRPSLPDWLAGRRLDATVQIGSLALADAEARDVQAHLLWDGAKADFENLNGRIDGGRITGRLAINVHGSRPAYRLQASVKGIDWKSGKVDTETVLETSGTGLELLRRLHASGTLMAHGVEMDALPNLESVGGSYDLIWANAVPAWRFSGLQLVSGDDTYTGQGATQPDGRLLIQLTSGSKQMHMSGTLAELRLDQPVAQ